MSFAEITAALRRRVATPLPRTAVRRWLRQYEWSAYLYLLPAAILLGVFSLWPMLFGLWISLWKWGIAPERFIGLDNYARIFGKELFSPNYAGQWAPGEVGQSLLVTTFYVIGTVPLAVTLAFLVAYLLFQPIRGRDWFRTIYFLPYVTSAVAAGMVFLWIFNPQVGVANSLLAALGLPTQTWLQDPDPALKKILLGAGFAPARAIPDWLAGPSVALCVVILFSIWNSLGFDVVIYLGGLANIPRELYEAAQIDGAEGWQLLRHITLPLVSPTTFFLLVVSIIRAFQAFTPIFVLSGGGYRGQAGGPLGSTMTITVYIFQNFYARAGAVGYAAAVSFVLLFIILALTLVQFRVVGRKVHYG